MEDTFAIIVNKSHHVGDNKFIYKFGRLVDFNEMSIALGSVSMFYSWRNITAEKTNNTFSIIHPNGATTNATLAITIPDGGYEVNDLNNYLRWYLISNGYYLQNTASGEQTVYAEFRINASTYSIEFVSYPLPTTLPTGWTAGSALGTLPTTTRAPQLVVPSTNFRTLIGFAAGTYPSSQQTTLSTTASTSVPVLSDVINVLLNADVISNPYAQNSFIIHAISPANTQYGHLITDSPNQLSYMKCQACMRDSIAFTFTDQNMLPLKMIDYDITIKILLSHRTI
jgi:hypothetical protein